MSLSVRVRRESRDVNSPSFRLVKSGRCSDRSSAPCCTGTSAFTGSSESCFVQIWEHILPKHTVCDRMVLKRTFPNDDISIHFGGKLLYENSFYFRSYWPSIWLKSANESWERILESSSLSNWFIELGSLLAPLFVSTRDDGFPEELEAVTPVFISLSASAPSRKGVEVLSVINTLEFNSLKLFKTKFRFFQIFLCITDMPWNNKKRWKRSLESWQN